MPSKVKERREWEILIHRKTTDMILVVVAVAVKLF